MRDAKDVRNVRDVRDVRDVGDVDARDVRDVRDVRSVRDVSDSTKIETCKSLTVTLKGDAHMKWGDEYAGTYELNDENGDPIYNNSKATWVLKDKGNAIWWTEDGNWVIGTEDNLGKNVRALTTNEISANVYLHEVPNGKWKQRGGR